MKIQISFLLWISTVCCLPLNASVAGARDSGGGNAVVCFSQDGRLISAESLDLYQGKLVARNYDESSEPYLEQAKNFAGILDEVMGTQQDLGVNFISNEVGRVDETKHMLAPGSGLVPIDDESHVDIASNCRIMQTAVYHVDKEVYFDSNIWNLLTLTNKAALLVHEALYRLLRFGSDTDSTRVKLAVAMVFSHLKLAPRLAPVNAVTEIEKCGNYKLAAYSSQPLTEFLSYKDQQGLINFQFLTIAGYTTISRSIVKVECDSKAWPLNGDQSSLQLEGVIASSIDGGTSFKMSRSAGILNIYLKRVNGVLIKQEVECIKLN